MSKKKVSKKNDKLFGKKPANKGLDIKSIVLIIRWAIPIVLAILRARESGKSLTLEEIFEIIANGGKLPEESNE